MRSINYFSATWCKSCQTIKEEIRLLKHNVDNIIKQDIIFTIHDIDEDSSLADEMEVTSVPSLVFIDENQKLYTYNGSNILEIQKYIDLFLQSSDVLIQGVVSNDINNDLENPPIYPSFKGVSKDNLITVQLSNEMNSIFSDNIIYHVVTNNLLTQLSYNTIESNNLDLFEYKIPILSSDGTCSNADRISNYSFNLAKFIYNVNNTIPSDYDHRISYLLKLQSVVNLIYDVSKGSEWIGIYRLLEVEDNRTNLQFSIKDRVLVKESYRGAPSRPLFPVTDSFARLSTNSWVALNGKHRVISNTKQIEEGVSYYECNGKVRSEICLPILKRDHLNNNYMVVGIIDIESWNENHFTTDIIKELTNISFELGKFMNCLKV